MKELPNELKNEFKELPKNKHSESYLEAINGNPEEKVGLVLSAFKNRELPVINCGAEIKRINILEIGPGGGSGLNILRKEVEEFNEKNSDIKVKMYTLDVRDFLPLSERKKLNKETKGKLVFYEGVVQKMPYREDSVSAINTSAVLHEVNSYDNGRKSVDDAIFEISRVIAPKGIWGYRDILAPQGNMAEIQQDIYENKAWIGFVKNFLPYFLDHGISVYERESSGAYLKQDGNNIDFQNINLDKKLEINAPASLIREIQRHFVTFRDFLLRNDCLGIKITEEKWKDFENGIKSLRIFIEKEKVGLIERLESQKFKKLSGGDYEIFDSLDFDELVDVAMQDFWTKIESGGKAEEQVLNDWLEREGREHYIYYNLGELIKRSAEISYKQSSGRYILMPQTGEDVNILPRLYYERYLKSVSYNYIPEGKQLVKFSKLDLESAKKALDNIKKSENFKKILGKEYFNLINYFETLIDN